MPARAFCPPHPCTKALVTNSPLCAVQCRGAPGNHVLARADAHPSQPRSASRCLFQGAQERSDATRDETLGLSEHHFLCPWSRQPGCALALAPLHPCPASCSPARRPADDQRSPTALRYRCVGAGVVCLAAADARGEPRLKAGVQRTLLASAPVPDCVKTPCFGRL